MEQIQIALLKLILIFLFIKLIQNPLEKRYLKSNGPELRNNLMNNFNLIDRLVNISFNYYNITNYRTFYKSYVNVLRL